MNAIVTVVPLLRPPRALEAPCIVVTGDDPAIAAALATSEAQLAAPADDVVALVQQFGSRVLLIDCSGAALARLLAQRAAIRAIHAVGGVVIAAIQADQLGVLPALRQAGATQFLVLPVPAGVLEETLHFAVEAAQRSRGAGRRQRLRRGDGPAQGHWLFGERSMGLSPALAALVGIPAAPLALPVARLLRRIDPADRGALRGAVRDLLADGVPVDLRLRFRDFADLARHVYLVVDLTRASDGSPVGVTATVDDLAAPEAAEALWPASDALTGLPSTSFVRDWVTHKLAQQADLQTPLGLLLLSVSRFDALNASHGRATADALLQQVARRLRRTLGQWDGEQGLRRPETRPLLGRLGGADFVVAMPGPLMAQTAMAQAQALIDVFERPFRVGGQVLDVACRIGITLATSADQSADALIHEATLALADAKQQPPGSVAVHSAATTTGQARVVESDLRQAIRREELSIVYQPQIDVETGAITGCEALVRWLHPALGPVDPEQFIELAEHAEFMSQLDDLILRKTLGEAARWSRFLRDRVTLSVNISASQLHMPGFEAWFSAALASASFDPARLTIEVTESSVIRNIEAGVARLQAIRALGVSIALDDFGTGHSNFAYLKALPVDAIKLDRSFMRGLATEKRDRVLVRTMIAMAQSLGLKTVAEGVETRQQLRILKAEGCDHYQGFLCSPPITVRELEAFSRRWTASRTSAL